MKEDRGSTTIWMLGLAMLLLLFGGLAIDFWRGLAVQRELAAVADSAAIAAASGLDEGHYRATGEVLLDASRAQMLAQQLIDFQGVNLASAEVSVGPDRQSVEVVVEGVVELGLLGVFIRDDQPLTVRASAVASPRRVP